MVLSLKRFKKYPERFKKRSSGNMHVMVVIFSGVVVAAAGVVVVILVTIVVAIREHACDHSNIYNIFF
jgi:hypothetical protein